MRAEDEVYNEDYEATDDNDDPEDRAKDGKKPMHETGFECRNDNEAWLSVAMTLWWLWWRCLNR